MESDFILDSGRLDSTIPSLAYVVCCYISYLNIKYSSFNHCNPRFSENQHYCYEMRQDWKLLKVCWIFLRTLPGLLHMSNCTQLTVNRKMMTLYVWGGNVQASHIAPLKRTSCQSKYFLRIKLVTLPVFIVTKNSVCFCSWVTVVYKQQVFNFFILATVLLSQTIILFHEKPCIPHHQTMYWFYLMLDSNATD